MTSHLGVLFEDDEDAVDVNVLCICDCHSGTARARRAALPPTLLLGLPMPSLLPPSSPFVRLSKFSMFIQFTVHPPPSPAWASRPRRGRTGTSYNTPPLPNPSCSARAWSRGQRPAPPRRVHQTDTPIAGQPKRGPQSCFQRPYGTGLRLFR